MLLLILLSQKFSESPDYHQPPWYPSPVAIYKWASYGHFPKIIIRHPGATQWPNWSIWSDWLKVGIIWSFSQNYHQTPWYRCLDLKVGIIWSFPQNYYQTPCDQWPNWSIWSDWPKVGITWSSSQNYHQTSWYPCFNPKIGIIWSFPQNYQQIPWYPCFHL